METVAKNIIKLDSLNLPSVKQAAVMLNVSVRTVWRMIAEGQLKTVHVRGCTRVYLQSVEEYLKQSEQVGCV
jgi:excisionase family DNA binding protein